MSGLAAVLAKRKEPGIYRWHGAFGISEVQHTVEHAGWRFAYVDGWHGGTKEEFLDAVGEALSFPEHYGRNFDALADCLHDVVDGHHPALGRLGTVRPATTRRPSPSPSACWAPA